MNNSNSPVIFNYKLASLANRRKRLLDFRRSAERLLIAWRGRKRKMPGADAGHFLPVAAQIFSRL
jgi:hypothetical protein